MELAQQLRARIAAGLCDDLDSVTVAMAQQMG
jgi:hypothetical protein